MSHRALHLLAGALLAALIPAAHAGEFVYQGHPGRRYRSPRRRLWRWHRLPTTPFAS